MAVAANCQRDNAMKVSSIMLDSLLPSHDGAGRPGPRGLHPKEEPTPVEGADPAATGTLRSTVSCELAALKKTLPPVPSLQRKKGPACDRGCVGTPLGGRTVFDPVAQQGAFSLFKQ
ncbi:hypothetical protein ROR02_13480 [Pararhodospirillum oryzae]|uniref:Uncharacterized protein n=1 Tax=Pararhodospirillum oryzae TaxID=478448 RepID=A0A512H6Z2_9PROT|nr:hypothetical protein ROR02_13480 [Pararhodospirillum oryzae]